MTVIHSNLPHLPIKGRSDLCSGGTIYVTEVCGKAPPSIPPDCAAIVQDSIHNKGDDSGPSVDNHCDMLPSADLQRSGMRSGVAVSGRIVLIVIHGQI
jgi:hypothetical protein